MKVKIKKLHPGVKTPAYATKGSACFDIYPEKVESAEMTDNDGCYESAIISTGLFFEIPEGKVLLVYSRSSQGFNHNIRLANCVGVIDSDFRGELKIKLTADYHTHNYAVESNKAVAQGMIVDVEQVSFEEVDELSETVRNTRGFGSTDK